MSVIEEDAEALTRWRWLVEHHNDLDGPILVCYDSENYGSLEAAIDAARLAGKEGV
jgi:hypothetical protein